MLSDEGDRGDLLDGWTKPIAGGCLTHGKSRVSGRLSIAAKRDSSESIGGAAALKTGIGLVPKCGVVIVRGE